MVPSLPPLSAIRPEPEQGEREPERHSSRPLQPQYQPQAAEAATAAAYALPAAAFQPRFQDAVYALRFATVDVQPPAIVFRPSHGDVRGEEAWRRIKTEENDDGGRGRGHGNAAYQHHHEQLRSMVQHYVGGTARHRPAEHGAFAGANGRSSQSGHSHSRHHRGSISSNGNRFSSSDDEGDDDNSGQRRGAGQRAGGHFASSYSINKSSQERYTMPMSMAGDGGGNGAMDASGRASFSSSDVYPDLHRSSSNGGSGSVQEDDFGPKLSKKARRKEQCRVNQANYRKRKRMYENELSGQIKLLENEILELKARKIALRRQPTPPSSSETEDQQVYNNREQQHHHQHRNHHHQQHDPIKSIGDFYYALESAQLELPLDAQLHYPGLHSLFELQQQEFASIDEFRLQWLWYREQFAVFNLLVSSSERLDAGDQVIIRISAQLHIQMQQQTRRQPRRQRKQNHQHQHERYQPHIHEDFEDRSDEHEENKDDEENDWLAKKLVCPVLQQFEFHADERVLTQITSEIDWIAGIAALVQRQPEHTLLLLRELADEAAASARFASYC